ncbi:MAG: protein kinase [Minicystis sp.]
MADRGQETDFTLARAQGRVGTVLRDKWRLDRLLGVGGMAAVYAATHRNGKRGAVKMLHVELSAHEEARRRFLQEGYVANAVAHPGAVSVLDDDVAEDGSVFLVMELLDGETAADRASMRPGERLDPGEVLAIADQILDALRAAHDKGIVHRDLKPENIFLTRDGHAKVLDFGLARLHDFSSAPRATKTGTAMGTPAFLPPEQALGDWHEVDGRTDLWALGATMFTLLTGRLVHVAEGVNKLMLAAMTKPAPRLATVFPGVASELAAVVDRALQFDRKDRFPDAAEMQRAVRRARAVIPGEIATGTFTGGLAAGASAARRSGEIAASKSVLPGPEGARSRRAAVLAAIGIGAVTGIVAVMVIVRGGPPAPAMIATAPAASPVPAALTTSALTVVPASSVAPADSAVPTADSPSPSAVPLSATTASARVAPRASSRPPGPRPTAEPAKDPFRTW